ncbi:Pex19-domain-containing protein [Wolfiporia cocos MD-104 SS10]|uniref:Pex19-domain-containing protein n=1 Tax=Wolfiporia cocos (strain MD-104) TaxID=742152 RepID=A0A2H3J655_WOLCO|nr:Pex19-domain-containing protein [Wolfiporia cocos MD-104 SS10]
MSTSQKAIVDEDDLDDLDDVLEQFSAPPAQKQAPAAGSSSGNKPISATKPGSTGPHNMNSDDDFTRELTRGMEALMREIAGEAGLGPDGVKSTSEGGAQTEEDIEREKAFKAAWEKMLIDGMNDALDPDDLAGDLADKGKTKDGIPREQRDIRAPGEDAFQASIRRTVEKLKESEASHKTEGPESMADIMAQLSEGLGDLGGGESEEELQKLLEGMMTQLMSKEILYEPLKELHDKFPAYLKDNADKISADDKKRYDSQYTVVGKIITIFEDPTYSDENTEKGTQIVTLMSEMQGYGSPPAEIMGPMPPGLDLGPDGMPKVPDGCTVM